MKERWLVRLLVDRDPESEAIPRMWDWDTLLQGGDPVLLMAQHVGFTGMTEEQLVNCCVCDCPMTVDDVNDGHTTRLHNYTDIRKPLPCHKECVPTVRTDYR